jgi:hypothetical protein
LSDEVKDLIGKENDMFDENDDFDSDMSDDDDLGSLLSDDGMV